MGASASKQLPREFVNLHVETDKQNFGPGEIVTGRVHIHVKKGCSLGSVKLTVRGKEEVRVKKVVTTTVNGVTTTHVHHFDDDKDHFRYVINLGHADSMGNNFGSSPGGMFAVPFEFVIPAKMVGSCQTGRNPLKHVLGMYEPNFWGCTGVFLTAEAELTPQFAAQLKKKVLDCAALREVNVIETPPQNQSKHMIEDKRVKCCCFGKGSCNIELQTMKDTYKAGDVVEVEAKMTNNSSRVLKAVNLRLVRVTHLYTEQTPCCSSKKEIRMVTANVIDVSETTAQQSVLPGKAQKVRLNLPLVACREMTPTTNGELVKVSYELVTMGQVDRCCTTDPELGMAVHIFDESPEVVPAPILPEGVQIWNPMVMEQTMRPCVTLMGDECKNAPREETKY